MRHVGVECLESPYYLYKAKAMNTNFFANTIIQDFLVREKRQFVLPTPSPESTSASARAVAALLVDIAQLGFTFDGPATKTLRGYSSSELKAIHSQLILVLAHVVGGDVEFRPLFLNFPENVPDDFEFLMKKFFSSLERHLGIRNKTNTLLSCGHVVNQQVFDLNNFGACPICQHAVPELTTGDSTKPPLSEITPLKVLSLAGHGSVIRAFLNAINSRTSVSASYQDFMQEVIRVEGAQIVTLVPTIIPFKENVALVVSMLVNAGVDHELMSLYLKTPTDVLRTAAAFSGGDLSLAQVCRFKLNNSQRRFIMGALETLPQSAEQLAEEMVGYRNRWVRLGEVLHIGQFTSRVPKAAACFNQLRNDHEAIKTFDSRVAHLFEKKALSSDDAAQLLTLLEQRPGEFARKLDALLLKKGMPVQEVMNRFAAIIPSVTTTTLLTMMAHFKTRGKPAEFRAFLPKGSVAKIHIQEGDSRLPISATHRMMLNNWIPVELMSRFSKKESMGKVFIDEELKNILVPSSQRSAATGLTTLPRGSRVSYDQDKAFLRLFLHWVENKDSGTVDVDLSTGLYSAEWDLIDQMSWTSMHSFGDSTHSGDVRSAPAPTGAAEFIDLDLKALRNRGIRYVVMMVYSWTGQKFNEFTAFAGVMERDKPQHGSHFEAKTVTQKFAVSSESTATAPLMVDLHTGEVIWMDISISNKDGGGRIENSSHRMVATAKVMEGFQTTKPSLYDLFELHAIARGQMVHSAEEADIVIDMKALQNVDEIVANFMS